MSQKWEISHLAAGLTAVVVGYSSAVVIVIEAAKAAGASPDMVTSWLLTLGLGMGTTCIIFSWLYKVPVVTAWSTPGAAFLIGSVQGYSLQEVIGSFVLAGVFSLIAAQNRFLTKKIESIPSSISSAMLAGILLPICVKVFADASSYPWLVFGFVAIYLIGGLWFPRFLMLILLGLGVIVSLVSGSFTEVEWGNLMPTLVWVTPDFSISATIGLAIPLFLITMLSQNLPGIAILKSYDFHPNLKVVLTSIGGLQILTAPFGGFAYNLAAITAAICMGEEAGSDRQQRYRAAIFAGVGYVIFGLMASIVVVVFTYMPQVVVHLLAGLALVATLQASLLKAIDEHTYRHAATITLLCTASGMILLHLGAPVWGLFLGLLVVGLQKFKANTQTG
ncbi:benzoate/H(+) symporter BenE family transporter [Glaciecola sp. 1036]|uniref:benzoate/H(+) symporter BenE family transporter n=1 Tax=Alteromonadaceae TaxID=72275 RepID=UPI003D00B26E